MIRFLLVEDDDDHAKIVERSMRQGKISNSLVRVSDGEEAMLFLRQQGKYASELLPDVVLLDLKLPKKDGHEVLLEMKADIKLRTIPVVVLTTSNAESDRLSAYEQHANSYLVKPLDLKQFRAMVDGLSLYWGIWNISVASSQLELESHQLEGECP
jgi:CheY-like chemotaxis protein